MKNLKKGQIVNVNVQKVISGEHEFYHDLNNTIISDDIEIIPETKTVTVSKATTNYPHITDRKNYFECYINGQKLACLKSHINN